MTRQVPREDPLAKRAMTENGSYLLYAQALGLRSLQSLLQQESALGGGDMPSRPAVPTLAGLLQDPTRGRAAGSAGSMAGVIIAEPPVGGPAAKTS